jgi:hypothetical protein
MGQPQIEIVGLVRPWRWGLMVELWIALMRIERPNLGLNLSLLSVIVAIHFKVYALACCGEPDEARRRKLIIDPRPKRLDHDQVRRLISQSRKTGLEIV